MARHSKALHNHYMLYWIKVWKKYVMGVISLTSFTCLLVRVEPQHHSDINARFVVIAEMIGATSLWTSRDKVIIITEFLC